MAAENPRVIHLSLPEYCVLAKRLLELDQRDFVELVLAGTYLGSQASVNALSDGIPGEPFSALRDYDSLLGIDANILVSRNTLMTYPVAKLEDTLSRNIHISSHFTSSSVCRLTSELSPRLIL